MAYAYPSARGWGSGYPNCQSSKMVTIGDVPTAIGTVTAFRVARVRQEIVELVRMLIRETAERGYTFKAGQCWGYVCRAVRGSTAPSFHSWGLAVDVNSATNWLGRADGGDIPSWMVALWASYGFFWGGNYSSRKDPMHFEMSRTPAEAARLTDKAKREIGGDVTTPEEKAALRRMDAFLDALTGPLKPGKDEATAAGAGERAARVILAVERDEDDVDGVDH